MNASTRPGARWPRRINSELWFALPGVGAASGCLSVLINQLISKGAGVVSRKSQFPAASVPAHSAVHTVAKPLTPLGVAGFKKHLRHLTNTRTNLGTDFMIPPVSTTARYTSISIGSSWPTSEHSTRNTQINVNPQKTNGLSAQKPSSNRGTNSPTSY